MIDRSQGLSIRSADYRITADAALSEPLLALGLGDGAGFDALLARARTVPGGRGPQPVLGLPDGSARLRLRPRRRGGWLARWLPRLGTSAVRVERELEVWRHLAAHGVPLPWPAAAIARRRRGGWACHFATLDRPGARDGLAWLAASASARERARAAAVVFASLRRLHDAGAVHGDLHLGNLLLEGEGDDLGCLFVDLDRARLGATVGAADRMRELMRLARSLEKAFGAAALDARLSARALAAYCGGDRALRAALLACAPRESRRLARHRLAWRVAAALGGRSGRRAALLATLFLPTALATGCDAPATRAGADAARWSIFALGDTGRFEGRGALFEGQLAVADALAREARADPVDGLVFLGDNFYDRGLVRDELVRAIRTKVVRPYCAFLALGGPRSAEVASACPVPADERRPVPLYAVLGNHDLGSPESAALQRGAVPEFLPDWRMSAGLTRVVEVHPEVSLVLFESEVAIDDRAAIRTALIDALRAARGPWRILVAHRPIATDDLGGLPVGGYPIWVRRAIAEAGVPVQLVLCGHHHSLQAFALGPPTPLLQIGAGSGSRAEPPLATGHPDLLHAEQALGFVRVDLVGAGDAEDAADADRLVVSLFRVPRWPWLERLAGHRRVARFAVDRRGRVDPPPVGGPFR